MSELLSKRDHLAALLRQAAPVLIAYSGGVDSALLLAEAHRVLGPGAMLGVIADSPSLPRQALSDALALAQNLGAPVEVIRTEELANLDYASNPVDRCFYCKAELFAKMEALAQTRSFRSLAYGENADDMRQVRPGRRAAEDFHVLAPMRDAGLTKAEVRALSRDLQLPTAEAPAQPCLSSRVPHGTPVTREALAMIERGEAFVRSLGFQVFRVRHLTSARALLQIAPAEMSRLAEHQPALQAGLQECGYSEVDFDPQGYRSGA